MPYIGPRVNEDLATKIQNGLKGDLPTGEFIVAIFKATRMKPMVDALVMTNQRMLAVYARGMSLGSGFPCQIIADDISKADVEPKRFGKDLRRLFITRKNNQKEFIADVYADDHDTILKIISRMSGSPELLFQPVEVKPSEHAQEPIYVAAPQERKYQSVCPRCGSDRLQAVQEMRTRGVSTVNSTAGCCCLGPLGLLCGLPGAGRSSTKTIRMCLNCGKKF